MNINSRIVFISNVFTWVRWKSLIQPSLTAESYGVTWEIATSGRSMEWEKKNVSRWIFLKLADDNKYIKNPEAQNRAI